MKQPYPVTVSDWISILQDKLSKNFNYQMFFATIIITVIVAVIPLLNELENTYFSALVKLVIILGLWGIFFRQYNKTLKDHIPYRELYDKIIRGEITEPLTILNEYNRIILNRQVKSKKGGKKMFSWKSGRYINIGLGIICIILALIFSIFLVVYDLSNLQEIVMWLTSIGLALVSFGIACHSVVLAIGSDKKVNDIANSNFLNILSKFEDRRIDLQYLNIGYIKHPVLIWKALVDLKEAEELLEFCNIELKHQTRLIDLLNHLLKFVNKMYVEVLNCEEVSHLLQMSLIGLKLDDQLTGKKNEAIGRVVTFFNDEQNTGISENYLTWMKDNIDEEIFGDNFFLRRDQLKEWYWSTINPQ